MKPTLLVCAAVALAFLPFHRPTQNTDQPLIEFDYVHDYATRDSTPQIEQCGYYLLLRGTIGHSGGYRPGALVRLQGDTLAARVSLYRAYDFDPKDWVVASWTLRIGDLDSRVYHVILEANGHRVIERDAKLSFRTESCAA